MYSRKDDICGFLLLVVEDMPRGLSRPRQSLQGKRKRSLSADARASSRSKSRSKSRAASGSRPRSASSGAEYDASAVDFFEQPEETILEPSVEDKYRLGGQIATKILKELCELVVPGASVMELCKKGDAMIAKQTHAHYAKPDEHGDIIERGIAFPTCINVNNIVCHYQPLLEKQEVIISAGDVVRVELGVHFDGYVNTAAHTILVRDADADEPSVPEQINIDVLAATYTAAAAALRLMKPGGSNHEVTDMFRSVAHSYGVDVANGVISHRMKRWDEAGTQIILGCTSVADQVLQDTVIFQPNQIWTLDVVFINGGDNTLRSKAASISDHFVFKRSEVMEGQRRKTARYVLNALRIQGNQCMMPFTLNTFDNPTKGVHPATSDTFLLNLSFLPCVWHARPT